MAWGQVYQHAHAATKMHFEILTVEHIALMVLEKKVKISPKWGTLQFFEGLKFTTFGRRRRHVKMIPMQKNPKQFVFVVPLSKPRWREQGGDWHLQRN